MQLHFSSSYINNVEIILNFNLCDDQLKMRKTKQKHKKKVPYTING